MNYKTNDADEKKKLKHSVVKIILYYYGNR